jgi:hypothetical protein
MENISKTSTPLASSAIEKSKEITNEALLEYIKKIHGYVILGKYDEKARNLFSKIAIELSKRNISPYERSYPKFKPIACKSELYSLYMMDIQTHDMQWIYSHYFGHSVDDEALDGFCEKIFSTRKFSWEKAIDIAKGSYEESLDKTNNLTMKVKLNYLKLPDHIQEELTILRSEKIRKRQVDKRNAFFKENVEKNVFDIKTMNVRNTLEVYLKSYSPKNKIIPNVDECMSVWIVIQKNGGNIIKKKEIADGYEKLAGVAINMSTLRRRIEFLQNASIL